MAGALVFAGAPRTPPPQVTGIGRGRNFVAPVTDAQGRKTVLHAEYVKPAGTGLLDLTRMQAETYRGQEKDMTFTAAQCFFDQRAHLAHSSDSLAIRTADQRFSIDGKSFRWLLGDSGLNSKLTISNAVHALIRKRLISATSAAPAADRQALKAPVLAPETSTNEFIEITSTQFDYETDRAIFRGKVHAHEVDGDLRCEVLTIAFRGQSGALEKIEAESDVVLDQGSTRAMADKATYRVGQDEEIVEFTGHAAWTDGQRQGSGERVTFDRRQRVLRAEEKAYLKLPRNALGEAGFMSVRPNAPAQHSPTNTAAFVEVFSEAMTLELPPTNGPVHRILAERNVLIVDPEQDGRALADRAEYQDSTGILELTGSPILETERRLINGRVLRFDRATRLFTAGPDAYVKLPIQALGPLNLVGVQTNSALERTALTNRFLEIWSKGFEYGTNQLRFQENVRANYLEGDVGRAQLTCALLTVRFGEQVQGILAEHDVRFEHFPLPSDPHGVTQRLACEQLRATFTPEGRLQMAVAEQGVSAEQEELRAGQAMPSFTRMTSETVTAFYSAVTNQVDKVVAEKDVMIVQEQRVARGAKAVYTQSDGLVELTGQPTANMPEGRIFEADALLWDRVRQRFMGKGKVRSAWKRPAKGTNTVASPTSTPK